MKLYKYFLFFCFLFIACDDNDDDKDIVPPVIPGGTLIEAEKIDDIDIGTLQESLGHVFAGVSSDIVNDDVLIPISAYRISYQTNHPNNTEKIIASGLLLIPESEEAPPIISYQHGTITEDESAPSYFEIHSDIRDYLTVLSGLKYIVSAPDYLGYQKSSNIPHPYEHGESLATASYDMLVAVKEFLEQEAVLYSDELFLTGFSEGGYASMALHEYIENNTETIVTGSIVAGGAYNKTQFSKEIMEKNETLNHIAYYLWVLHSYNLVYNLNLPFSFFITEDNIAEIIANINNLSGADIDKNPQNLFTEEFRNLILTDADHPFVDAIRDNNRLDWEPKGFVRIYHGSEDAFVFPSNAITAYEAIRSENNEGLVTLELLNTPNQKTHEGSGVLFHTLLPIILHQERGL